MIENNFKTEKNEQSLIIPTPDNKKSPWHSPRLDVLSGSNTEQNVGTGGDGGPNPFSSLS